jgi:O-antigen/teichoic acid export membrane protein
MRTKRAAINALFGYSQFGLAMIAGLFMVPFTIHRVGSQLYGLWLASGEILAYAAMADLGVAGTLVWLVARADGSNDRQGLRDLLAVGVATNLLIAVAYASIVLALWRVLPVMLHLSEVDRTAIQGPLLLLALTTAIVIPLRVFSALLHGLQDVAFTGTVTSVSWAMDVAITVALLSRGYRLWALAAAAAFPALTMAVLTLWRARRIAPDLFHGWPRPRLRAILELLRESIGAWFGQLGWRMSSATDGIIVAALGRASAVTVLACTSKLANMLTQMAWLPGDSGLVGLSNLHGEEQPERLRHAVLALVRVYLSLAIAGASVVLAANPAFVARWVGPGVFGGLGLNVAVALALVALTLGHAFAVVAAVLGARLHVGVVSCVGGAVQVALAFALARVFGLPGVVAASILAQTLVLAPGLIRPFLRLSHVRGGDLVSLVAAPLAWRSIPLVLAAAAVGAFVRMAPLWLIMSIGAAAGVIALWLLRPMFLAYPPIVALLHRATGRFLSQRVRHRLFPAAPSSSVSGPLV